MTYTIDDYRKLRDFLLAHNNRTSQILTLLLTLLLRRVKPIVIAEDLEPLPPSSLMALDNYENIIAGDLSKHETVFEVFKMVSDFAIAEDFLDFEFSFAIYNTQEFDNLEDKADILFSILCGYLLSAFRKKRYSAGFIEEITKAIKDCCDRLYTKYITAENQDQLKEVQPTLSAVNLLRLKIVRFLLPSLPRKEVYELYFMLLQHNLFYSQQLSPFCAEMVAKSPIYLSCGETERSSSQSQVIYFLSGVVGPLIGKDDDVDFLEALTYAQRIIKEQSTNNSGLMTVTDLANIFLAFYLVAQVYKNQIDDNSNLKQLRRFLEQITVKVSDWITSRKKSSPSIFTFDLASIVIKHYLVEIARFQRETQELQTNFKHLKIQKPFGELLSLMRDAELIEPDEVAAIITFEVPHEVEKPEASSAQEKRIEDIPEIPVVTEEPTAAKKSKKRSKGKSKATLSVEKSGQTDDDIKKAPHEPFQENTKEIAGASITLPAHPTAGSSQPSIDTVSNEFESSVVPSALDQKISELVQLGENFRLGSLSYNRMGLFQWLISLQSALILLHDCIESIEQLDRGRVLLQKIFGANYSHTVNRWQLSDIKDFRHWWVHNPSLFRDFQASSQLRAQFKLIVDSLAKILIGLEKLTAESILTGETILNTIIFRPILTMTKPGSQVMERQKNYGEYGFSDIRDLKSTDFPIIVTLADEIISSSEPNKVVTEGLLARIGEFVGHSDLAATPAFKPLIYWRNVYFHTHLERPEEDERKYGYRDPTQQYQLAVAAFNTLWPLFLETSSNQPNSSSHGVHHSPGNPRSVLPLIDDGDIPPKNARGEKPNPRRK